MWCKAIIININVDFFDKQKAQKNSIYLKYKYFVTFWITFEQFTNASLLNESINIFYTSI